MSDTFKFTLGCEAGSVPEDSIMVPTVGTQLLVGTERNGNDLKITVNAPKTDAFGRRVRLYIKITVPSFTDKNGFFEEGMVCSVEVAGTRACNFGDYLQMCNAM